MGSTTSHASEILGDVDRQLAAGVDTTIGIDKEPVTLISFDLAKTGDMPQQNTNCALVSHRSARSCRMCHIVDEQRDSWTYDIRLHGRYLSREDKIRHEAMQLGSNKARSDQLKYWGLKEYRSMWLANQPAFLPNRMTPQECCHIFVQGLAQVYQEILVDHILKQSAHSVYSEAVRQWPIPPQWARLPSPTNHHRSYSYNQYGQIAQLNPYVLRSCLANNMITIQASAGIQEEFAAELADTEPSDIIVQLLSELPKLLYLVFQPSINPEGRSRIHRQAIQFLESYKRFIKACAPVKSRKSYLQRSNLHAVNHVLDTIQDYGTASNVKCSPGMRTHCSVNRSNTW
jgi:hypothetical protein